MNLNYCQGNLAIQLTKEFEFEEEVEIKSVNKTEDKSKEESTTLNDSIKLFKNYLKHQGKSKNTAISYIIDMEQFYEFNKNKLNNRIRYVKNLTKEDIEVYKKYLHDKRSNGEYQERTVYRKYNSLKVFCQFLNHEFEIEDFTKGDKLGNRNSINDWNNDCNVNNTRVIIKDEELKRLFKTLEDSNDRNIIRDTAIIEVLMATGCRRSELIELKWQHIDFYNKEITIVRPKTRNFNSVKVSSRVINSLTALKRISGKLVESEYVFRGSTKKGKKISKTALNSVIKKWVKKANINPKITTHSFRHTFVTTCLKKGISNEIIIKYTGHSDVSALKPYTHLVATDTKEVADIFERI